MLIDVSGLGFEISGASDDLDRELSGRWSPFIAEAAPAPVLRVEIRYGGAAPSDAEFDPRGMSATLEAASATFAMDEGRVRVGADATARFELATGLGTLEFFVWANLLHAALAWWLPRVGGAMLHAAGVVIDGRAHVLVGSEGAGKSTWAGLARDDGLYVLSDDIVIVHESPEGTFDALGTPFRSKDWDAVRPGRWPLAVLLFSKHGPAAALDRTTPLITRARLAANLPFVQKGIDRDERLAGLVERLATGVRSMELTFARDRSFLELLRRPDRWP